jgi:CII-binding regulator of phage lambda lysogenization HflD
MSNELTAVVKRIEEMKEQLLSAYASLPSEVVSVLLNKFTIHGAILVTLDEIKALLTQAVSQMHT